METTSPPRSRSFLARTRTRLWRVAGWTSIGVLLGAELVDRSGVTRTALEGSLRAWLPEEIGELHIERANIHWLRRTLVVRGVRLGDQRLDRVEITLGSPWNPVRGVRRVTVTGGRIVLEAPAEWPPESGGAFPERLPELALDGVSLALPARQGSTQQPIVLGSARLAITYGESGLTLVGEVERQRDAGTTARITVHGQANTEGADWTARGRGEDLPLELLASILPGQIRELEGRLDFEVSGRDLGQGPSISASIETRMDHLVPSEGLPRCEDMELVLQLAREASSAPLAATDAWVGRLSGGGRVGGLDVILEGERREGSPAEAWARIEECDLGPGIEQAFGSHPALEKVRGTIAPSGTADIRLALRAPVEALSAPDLLQRVEFATSIDPRGTMNVRYHGRVSPRGKRDLGFPLPGKNVEGRVLAAVGPGRTWETEIGLIDLGADIQVDHRVRGTGAFHVHGREGEGRADTLQLILTTPEISLDESVREALEGLAGVLPPERNWERYRPSAGTATARVELWVGPRTPAVASRVQVEFQEVGMSWASLAIPVTGVHGHLDVASDGQRSYEGGVNVGVALSLVGESEVCEGPIEIDLYVRQRLERDRIEDPVQVVVPVEWLQISVPAGRPDHPLFLKALETSPFGLLGDLRRLRIRGPVDTLVRQGKTREDARSALTVVASPLAGCSVHPQAMEKPVTSLSGRVIATRAERPGAPLELRATPLRGLTAPIENVIGVQAEGMVQADGERFDIDLHVAGLSTQEGGFTGWLERMGMGEAVDTQTLGIRVELDGRARLRRDRPEAPLSVGVMAFAHDGEVTIQTPGGVERLFLREGEGRLEYDGQRIHAERLRGRFLDTPIEARDVQVDPEGPSLAMDLVARNFPLDRSSLAYLMPPEQVDSILGDLGWRSEIDTFQGHFSLDGSGDEQLIEVAGSLALGPTSVRFGLPVSIGSARIPEFGLRIEGQRVSFWSRVEEIFGRVAGRALDRAGMLVSYVEPHLSIRDLEGRFAEGSLTTLGLEGQASEDFFSVDLAPPYPFSLSARMQNVEAGELLRGLFHSNFANRGRLEASLRVAGDLARLTDIEGQGSVRLYDSSLWAIPVFQALFSQLGFETTATFQAMESRLKLADGRITLSDMRLQSDLLSLVGEGWVDLDGRISNDLEVRYSLVDGLGPLTYIVYLIQNGLLQVFVRGDLSRPRVQLGGVLSVLLGRTGERPRELPLPGSSPLPPRF